MKEKLDKLLPKFARLPLLTVLLLNFAVYYITKIVTVNEQHFDLTIPLDREIPFVPAFIIVYILAYVQWVFSYLYHCTREKRICLQITATDCLAKVICMLFFIFLPTMIVRPEITDNDVFSFLTKIIYTLDTPVNLFPSIHCLESWICFRGALLLKKVSKTYIVIQLVFTILVFTSTVFVKQHFFVDIIASIALVEIAFVVVKKTSLWKLLDRKKVDE